MSIVNIDICNSFFPFNFHPPSQLRHKPKISRGSVLSAYKMLFRIEWGDAENTSENFFLRQRNQCSGEHSLWAIRSQSEVEVKLFVCTSWRHWWRGSIGPLILKFSTRGEVSSQTHATSSLPQGDHGTHGIGGWARPRGGLESQVKRKIFCPCQESSDDNLVVQLATRWPYRPCYDVWRHNWSGMIIKHCSMQLTAQ